MAIRRQPQMPGMMGGAQAQPGMIGTGQGQPSSGAGPMMPKPPMTTAPAGNANPDAQNGSPMVPPSVDPAAGGPTAPGNIQSMLQTNVAGPTGPQRRPLPPWGDSQGDGRPPMGMPAPPLAGAFDTTKGTFGADDSTYNGDEQFGDKNLLNIPGRVQAGASGPMVMLKLLKSLGHL